MLRVEKRFVHQQSLVDTEARDPCSRPHFFPTGGYVLCHAHLVYTKGSRGTKPSKGDQIQYIYIYSRSNHDLERSTVYTSTPTPKRRFLLSFGTRWVLIIHQRCASPTIAVPVLNNGTNPYSPRSVQSCVAPGEKLLTPNSACSMLPRSVGYWGRKPQIEGSRSDFGGHPSSPRRSRFPQLGDCAVDIASASSLSSLSRLPQRPIVCSPVG